jgi:endogenous inhibitor of DNA gyrase (YacG/DUF329 family)
VSARRRGEKLAARPGKATEAAAPARKGPRCPMCGKPATAEFRPFCSRRCADIDLSRWLGGRYAVPGEPIGSEPEPGEPELEEDEGVGRMRRSRQGGDDFL